ncbi:MAG: glutamyl-tRNA reductase [Gammaproteobacteria bacterium]|nr:glutamyl-tRNA reductase [Gammaproteobacteria bacterium]
MPILVCGIHHKTAPISLREKVVFSQEKLSIYLQDLVTQENIQEAVILSTCNRSELYCNTDDMDKMTAWFCRQHQISKAELLPFMYFHQETAAIEHIMQVACGLDSMVLGESQILGQMKAAYSESCAADAIGPTFNRLFQQVFAVAKEVRNSTAIGACPMSVSSAAVHFAKQVYQGEFNQATILLIGAGPTIDLAWRHLKTTEPQSVLIVNRSKKNAEMLAQKYAGDVVCFSKITNALSEADIVIAATGSALPIISKSMIAERTKPLHIIDIAVPRDIEPNVLECDFVHLYSIDDLKPSIQFHLDGREHSAKKAREMIKQKSQDFITWLHSLDMMSLTIRAYREKVEDLCHAELAKAMQQLNRGDDPVQVLASFAHALTNKLLHTPSVQLREAAFAGRLDLLQLARQLFAIPESVL